MTPAARLIAHDDEAQISGRILVAEDAPDVQRLMAFLLRSAGRR
jgi:CheY-like chemotaxis protein